MKNPKKPARLPRKAPSNQTGGTAWGKKLAAEISRMAQAADMKKLILLNFPYIIAFYMVEKAAWLYRHCNGDSVVDRLMVLFMNFGLAYKSVLPSFHPFDLMVGLVGAAALKAVIYFKGKNAKKYRQGEEYGSARWGNQKDIEPFIDPVFENNVILTQTERLMMSGRPKHPKYARNKNVIVIGGSGSGKTRFYVKPNLMQMPPKVSYVVTDPKGTIIIECGKMLSDAGYKIKVLNTINFKKSIKKVAKKGVDTATGFAHNKVHQVEKENSGVESAHKSEETLEELYRFSKGRKKTREKSARAEKRGGEDQKASRLKFSESEGGTAENAAEPSLKKKQPQPPPTAAGGEATKTVGSKFYQKKQYKDAYAAAKRGQKAGNAASKQAATAANTLAEKAKAAVQEIVVQNKTLWAGLGIAALMLMLIMGAFSSCSAAMVWSWTTYQDALHSSFIRRTKLQCRALKQCSSRTVSLIVWWVMCRSAITKCRISGMTATTSSSMITLLQKVLTLFVRAAWWR